MNKEKIDALQSDSSLDPDYVREEVARLSMMDYSNTKYVSSLEKSLRVLFAAACILRRDKDKKKIFDSFLQLINAHYPRLSVDDRISKSIAKTIGAT
jgi:hypothetical protein